MSEGYFIHQFALGPWDNFIYLLGCSTSRKCAVVDPAWDATFIQREIDSLDLELTDILCTHSHFDHVDQVEALLDRHDVPVHMLKPEVEWSGFTSENLVRQDAGAQLSIGDHLEVTFVHTPGHTPGSTSYLLHGEALLTGDTLFVQGCGRCDFVGGNPEVMYGTLRTLLSTLPRATRLYPGHHYGPTPFSTVDEELRANPFLRLPTVADFVDHRMKGKVPNSSLPPRPDWSAP